MTRCDLIAGSENQSHVGQQLRVNFFFTVVPSFHVFQATIFGPIKGSILRVSNCKSVCMIKLPRVWVLLDQFQPKVLNLIW